MRGLCCAGDGVEAEEHGGEDGHEEDVDIENVEEEPEEAPQEEGDEAKAASAAEEPQLGQAETQVWHAESSVYPRCQCIGILLSALPAHASVDALH